MKCLWCCFLLLICVLLRHRLPSFERTPVWLIHGTFDEIVPFYHAEDNFKLIPEKLRALPLYIVGGGHNDLETLTR